MNPIILAIGLLLVFGLAIVISFQVGVMIATGAVESRVINYVNKHPSRQMFRMADRLFGEKRFLHAEPWGALPDKINSCSSEQCQFPSCDCPVNMIPNNNDQHLFI